MPMPSILILPHLVQEAHVADADPHDACLPVRIVQIVRVVAGDDGRLELLPKSLLQRRAAFAHLRHIDAVAGCQCSGLFQQLVLYVFIIGKRAAQVTEWK